MISRPRAARGKEKCSNHPIIQHRAQERCAHNALMPLELDTSWLVEVAIDEAESPGSRGTAFTSNAGRATPKPRSREIGQRRDFASVNGVLVASTLRRAVATRGVRQFVDIRRRPARLSELQ